MNIKKNVCSVLKVQKEFIQIVFVYLQGLHILMDKNVKLVQMEQFSKTIIVC